MLSRALPLVRRSSHQIRYQVVRCMGGHVVEHKSDREIAIENKMTLDDLPTPEGSWAESYQKRQRSYNIQLGASVILSAITVYVMLQSGALFWNPAPDYKKVEVNWDEPDIPPVEE